MPASQTTSASLTQAAIVIAFGVAVAGVGQWVYHTAPQRAAEFDKPIAIQPATHDPAEAERCKVPDFAKALGHEEK